MGDAAAALIPHLGDTPVSFRSVPGSADSAERDSKRIIQAIRIERFALLSAARRVISAAGRSAGLKYGHDLHRTAKCKYIRHGDCVSVHLDKVHKKAFFSGLVTCGSVWSCPVCAAKIQERRREEVAKGVAYAYKNGMQTMLITLTFPHRSWQKLRVLLEQQADALKRLRQGSPWGRFKTSVGYKGLIRSLELTHGQNGWHPHTHELWLVAKDADPEMVKAQVLKRWESACIRAGLLDASDVRQVEAFRTHAVDVKGNCSASDYLAKQDDSRHWGVDHEIAKATSKAGKASGKHAFALLAESQDDKRSARLFMVYILAMRGKRQIFWSQGLKKAAGVDEISDEVLAEQEREESDWLGNMTDDDWHTVRGAEGRAQLLNAAESGGWVAVQALIERLTIAEIQRLEALLHPFGGSGSTRSPQSLQ
jgi:hypothetical protein